MRGHLILLGAGEIGVDSQDFYTNVTCCHTVLFARLELWSKYLRNLFPIHNEIAEDIIISANLSTEKIFTMVYELP